MRGVALRRGHRAGWAVSLAGTLAACVAMPGTTGEGSAAGPLPTGYGTLRQDDVTVALSSGDLQVKVTPLAESVTRVTAPDTYRRLRGLVEAHGARLRAEPGAAPDGGLFLVSFFSDRPDVAFLPEEVQLISRGIRVRPAAIVPITPSWGQRRLRQRQTESAVYVFDRRVDLESDLIVAYGLVESSAWSRILPEVVAERARVRSRAGGAQPSRPYFEILR